MKGTSTVAAWCCRGVEFEGRLGDEGEGALGPEDQLGQVVAGGLHDLAAVVRMTSPEARTTSRPITWWRVTLHFTARMPPALVLTLPPSEALHSPGNTG